MEGSDHVPVYVILRDVPDLPAHSTPSIAVRYIPEVRGWQQSIGEKHFNCVCVCVILAAIKIQDYVFLIVKVGLYIKNTRTVSLFYLKFLQTIFYLFISMCNYSMKFEQMML